MAVPGDGGLSPRPASEPNEIEGAAAWPDELAPEHNDDPEMLEELSALEALADDPRQVEGGRPRLPEVRWAADADQPDYAHLTAADEAGVTADRVFTFDLAALRVLIAANHFRPRGHNNAIVFGLRGARLVGGDRAQGVRSVRLEDVRPDHQRFCCTLGHIHLTDGTLSAFMGSTVPNAHYMRNYYKIVHGIRPRAATRANCLPTGCYIYRVGAHRKRVFPALRMTDPDRLTHDAVCTVLRTSDDLSYGHGDHWDRSMPYDNIHCAFHDDRFSSAGCQTIKGADGAGPWGAFQEFLRTGRADTRFDYVLLTGREAAIAAAIVAAGRAGDAALVRRCLERLRVGSEGEAVTRLQKRLGFNGTGYFGPSTKLRLTEREAAHGRASDGIYAPDDDAAFGWGVFPEASGTAGVGGTPKGGPGARDGKAAHGGDGSGGGALDRASVRLIAPDPRAVVSEDGRLLVIDGEGSWRVGADGTVTFAPADGFVGTPTAVRYEVSDRDGASASGVITITVEAPDLPPVAEPDAAVTEEGEALVIDVLRNDSDPEDGLDPASVRLVPLGGDEGAEHVGTLVTGDGVWTAGTDGTIRFAPADGVRDRTVSATYSVADRGGQRAQAKIEVLVRRKNLAPEVADDAARTVAGVAVVIDVLANDADPDSASDRPTPGAPPSGRRGSAISLTREAIARFAPHAAPEHAAWLAEHADAVLALYAINENPVRLCHFLAQIAHESAGFSVVRERLVYTSARRLVAVWPSRFPDEASAAPFVRNEEALAEKVYGGRLGNTEPGDGFRYRGRGYIQITGRANYREMGELIDLPLEREPETVERPHEALLTACAYFAARKLPGERGLSALADDGKIEAITYRVNGGYHGLDDRMAWLRKARGAIGATIALEPSGDIVERGDRGPAVRRLQGALIAAGVLGGSADGKFGHNTYKALRAFKAAADLPGTGYADAATFAALRGAKPPRRGALETALPTVPEPADEPIRVAPTPPAAHEPVSGTSPPAG